MKGKKTHSLYNTPFGDLLVGIYTHNLEINATDKCCAISADYEIEINDKPNGRNVIEINVMEAKNNE